MFSCIICDDALKYINEFKEYEKKLKSNFKIFKVMKSMSTTRFTICF